jgi:UDP-N-acetylmuramate--alanine ligase
MHIYFSAIGGAGIGPLALLAHKAGYEVSGSDKSDSEYIDALRKEGITDIYIGQSADNIALSNSQSPIDWFVYSSAVLIENPDSPEVKFCEDHHIKISKRDELLNQIILDHKFKLIAVAGTHGKSTTTAMIIWMFKQLGLPLSYSLGAKIGFGDDGEFDKSSEFFVYEADEFDRNFLSFKPYISVLSGVTWDHHEIYKTRAEYQKAFINFVEQSKHTIVWQEDNQDLKLDGKPGVIIENPENEHMGKINLYGKYTRLDAYLAVSTLHEITNEPIDNLIPIINKFPGLKRRMEKLVPNLYTDYAHTPEKIRGAMSVALEMASQAGQNVVVIYEPLTDRRQHFIIDEYKDCFAGAKTLYWIPSYLAREDPDQKILSPEELISHLADPSIAKVADKDEKLEQIIKRHILDNDMVVAMNGGGSGSLDEWLRQRFPG